jgi:hypothetical protein
MSLWRYTAGHDVCVFDVVVQVSECLLHKYSCVLSVLLAALLLQPGKVLVVGGKVAASVRAMAAHKSQWVW